MKQTIIIIALFVLSACNSRTDKSVVDQETKSVYVDSLNHDSNEINGVAEQPHKEFQNCNFDNFITDKRTPKLAKDIYLDNDWNLSNDTEALALLDSLTAKNKTLRPFYFKVVTKSYKKSDGYFSEALGLAGKEYIENNTKEFISNFDNKDCFPDNDLATWADIAILDFSISREGEYDKPLIDDYIKKIKSNCKDCSTSQKENLNHFGVTLQNKWNDFLKNIDK